LCLVLQRVAGKDASKQFWKYHNEGILKKYKGQLQIGSLDTKKAAPAPPAPAPAPKKAAPEPKSASSSSVTPPAAGAPQDPYGELIPFADPSWYQGVSFEKLLLLFICHRSVEFTVAQKLIYMSLIVCIPLL
jgi:hypothetical protein